jgi:hypothetical protein
VTEQLQLHFERNEAFVQLFAVGANNTHDNVRMSPMDFVTEWTTMSARDLEDFESKANKSVIHSQDAALRFACEATLAISVIFSVGFVVVFQPYQLGFGRNEAIPSCR